MGKTIGIFTFHKAYNYGAQLQCYSLFHRIRSEFPDCKVEVIDFESKTMADYYELTGIKKLLLSLSSAEKKHFLLKTKIVVKWFLDVFNNKHRDSFIKNRNISIRSGIRNLSLSSDCVVGEAKDFVNCFGNKYDIIVVGSDAVWNDKQVGNPNPFYLDAINTIKMSYAASSYGMDFQETSDESLASIFSSFSYLGLRDDATSAYVRYYCSEMNVFHNCDPSIFLDLKKLPVSIETVKEKLIRKGVDFNRPIIGLMCDNWLAKQVRSNLGDQYQYVALYCWNDYADFYADNLSPFEWAVVFGLFSATFTHFFHGTLFSIKNHVVTFSIERRTPYSKKYKTKIVDVLDRIGLSDIHFFEDELDSKNWELIKTTVSNGMSDQIRDKVDYAILEESKTAISFFEALKETING